MITPQTPLSATALNRALYRTRTDNVATRQQSAEYSVIYAECLAGETWNAGSFAFLTATGKASLYPIDGTVGVGVCVNNAFEGTAVKCAVAGSVVCWANIPPIETMQQHRYFRCGGAMDINTHAGVAQYAPGGQIYITKVLAVENGFSLIQGVLDNAVSYCDISLFPSGTIKEQAGFYCRSLQRFSTGLTACFIN